MDSFEAIRVAALKLHEEVVAKGSNPLHPLSFVESAIEHLELELSWLPKSDPALKGAQASFDGQTGIIFCENSGSNADKSILVAHEIGHEQIHIDSASCSEADINPSQSIESAPVGLQKVEDYGARERRELQANVFAREFLFPRTLAKKLYLDERKTTSEIARITGLPINLIRQQVLDAILLPEIPEVDDEEKPKNVVLKPDEAQDRAAEHRNAPFQLQAGPGTGKTRTLIKRITSLISEGIQPQSILVLTFSNRAAGELSERLSLKHGQDAANVWMGTFHAFGLDLIRRFYEQLNLPADPSLFDRSDAIEVLEDILPTLPLRHYKNLWDPAIELKEILSAISRAKDELVGVEEYKTLAQDMRHKAISDEEIKEAEKCLEVASIYEHYEKAKNKHGAVDFGDLIMLPTLLLEENEALRQSVQLRHRHILVDEYQDVNRASVRLLKAIAGDGQRLWVVGDARQSIYRFRGASSINMVCFPEDFKEARVEQLEINYRSTQEVVDTFVSFAEQMKASAGMLSLNIEASRREAEVFPEIRKFYSLEDEAGGVASSIRELEESGVKLKDQVVLCRKNARLNEIASELERRGIPVLHLGSLFERDDIRDLLAVLSLAVEPFGSGLIRMAKMPRYKIPLQDVFCSIEALKNSEEPTIKVLKSLAQNQQLSEEGRKGFSCLAKDLSQMSVNSTSWDFLADYVLDRSDYCRNMAAAETIPDKMRAVAVWQFLNFVRDQSPVYKGLPIRRTLDRVRQLVLFAEERDLRQVPAAALHMDAVRLMTIHGSKGLEFEAAHIPGLTVTNIPSSRKGQRCKPPEGMVSSVENLSVSEEAVRSHEEEEECLFFVALSRAKTYLRIYRSPIGRFKKPSPFLDRLPKGKVYETENAACLKMPDNGDQSLFIEVKWPENWSLKHEYIASYEKCPRKFFYTHVMGLQSSRQQTAFSKTHSCIYSFIDWLTEKRLSGAPDSIEVGAAFDKIWKQQGPVDHAYEKEYHDIALNLVKILIDSGSNLNFKKPEPLGVNLASGSITVTPSEILESPDGAVILRHVRTGRKRSDEYDRLEYTLYTIAADQNFNSNAVVEALHLSDQTNERVEITNKKLQFRKQKIQEIVADLSSGLFPPKTDPVSCPRCPHFFICAATPDGSLTIPEKK